jgi:hypothetical protein
MLLHNILYCVHFFENTKEKFKIYFENALNYWKRKKEKDFYFPSRFWPSPAAARQRASAYLPRAAHFSLPRPLFLGPSRGRRPSFRARLPSWLPSLTPWPHVSGFPSFSRRRPDFLPSFHRFESASISLPFLVWSTPGL